MVSDSSIYHGTIILITSTGDLATGRPTDEGKMGNGKPQVGVNLANVNFAKEKDEREGGWLLNALRSWDL